MFGCPVFNGVHVVYLFCVYVCFKMEGLYYCFTDLIKVMAIIRCKQKLHSTYLIFLSKGA